MNPMAIGQSLRTAVVLTCQLLPNLQGFLSMTAAISILSVLVSACISGGITADHQSGEYNVTVTPHPDLGSFKLTLDSDRPILAYYGGIGLQLDKDGAWTDYGITSTDAVDYLIERCATNGMKRICANIMFQWTSSKLLSPIPNTPVPDNAESLFGYAVREAHRNNIEVYIDIPVFGRRTRDEAFAKANPDVYAKSIDGEVREEYFSPAHPKVRAYRIAVLLEALSKYPVDGILLDFIRWPNYDADMLGSYCTWGYEDVMLEQFREAFGLPDDYVPTPDDPRFVQARADVVTSFIRELRAALADNGIDLSIGVYNSNIYGREASLRHVSQDWAAWERLSLVDQHHPMFYMDNMARLTRGLGTLMAVKRPGSTVFGPVFLDGPGPFTDDLIVEAARRMIKVGAEGVWFCREMEIESLNLWPTIKRVSELSISDIRAQDFDPYEENLAENGGFDSGLDGWSVQPDRGARVELGPSAESPSVLEVRLDMDSRIEISQVIQHNASPVIALRSLGISLRYRSDQVRADEPVQLVLDQRYSDGSEESRSFVIPVDRAATPDWQDFTEAVVVGYSDGRYLQSTAVRVVSPRGEGFFYIDGVFVTHDPLHNPMNPNLKDSIR
jgi:Glycosyl hydrolase-like 10